nr:hypothetical protein StreXyl84_54640 [Streptomyces sp. Xyl84]
MVRVVRRTTAGLAVAGLMTMYALTACGPGPAPATGAGPGHAGTSGGPARPLSERALEQAAITGTDLKGYEVRFMATAAPAAHRAAAPAACTPVVHALGAGSGFTATARAGRQLFSEEHGPGATMTLSSHSLRDATRVIGALRTAAERCRTFEDVQAGFRYEAVALRPDPDYGDASVSLRLTQLAAGDQGERPVRVPYAVVAVRLGTTVVMFSAFHRPGRSGGEGPAVVPDVIIRTQLAKLGEATAAE